MENKELDYLDVLNDRERLALVHKREERPSLFTFPGALGDFLNRYILSTKFIIFLAPEKRGKTWWLIYTAYRALLSGKKVLFLQAGDMTEEDFIIRWHSIITKSPFYSDERKEITQVPESIKIIKDGYKVVDIYVNHKEVNFTKTSIKDDFEKLYSRFVRRCKNGGLRVLTHANSTVSPRDLENILTEMQAETDWLPDVLIIDYMDILKTDYSTNEFRHGENDKWKQIRRISQEFDLLIVSATQSDAKSYSCDWLTMDNFSEDKRKFAHVTGCIGLNQNRVERNNGLMRLNWVVLREGRINDNDNVMILQDFSTGRVCVDSVRTGLFVLKDGTEKMDDFEREEHINKRKKRRF